MKVVIVIEDSPGDPRGVDITIDATPPIPPGERPPPAGLLGQRVFDFINSQIQAPLVRRVRH